MSGPIQAVLLEMAFIAALLGAAMAASAWGLWRRWKDAHVMVFAAVGPALLFLILLLGVKDPEGRPFYQQMRAESVKLFDTQSELLLEKGALPADQMEAAKRSFTRFYVDLLPGWIAVTCLFLGWFAFFLTAHLLARVDKRFRRPEPYRTLSWPDPWVFGLILAIGLLAVAPVVPQGESLRLWGGCLLVVFGALYLIVGLAIVVFFFWKWSLHPLLRLLLYVALLLTPSSVLALAILGAADVWMDFRRLKPAPVEGKAGS